MTKFLKIFLILLAYRKEEKKLFTLKIVHQNTITFKRGAHSLKKTIALIFLIFKTNIYKYSKLSQSINNRPW